MTGIERIAAERLRQIEKKGWTPEHDDEHDPEDLEMAAACYAIMLRAETGTCLHRRPQKRGSNPAPQALR